MKTSNKIITGIIAAAILIPAIVAATVLIKLSTGNYEKREHKSELVKKEFPGIRNLTIRGMENLTIIPSDSLHAELYPYTYDPRRVQFVYAGDSVLIFGDTTYTVFDTARDKTVTPREVYLRSSDDMKLYLPSNIALSILKCNFSLSADNEEREVDNYTLQINESTMEGDVEDSARLNFRNLSITAGNSLLHFNNWWSISNLDLTLKNKSVMKANESRIDVLTLAIDSLSSIEISGNQIKKLIQKK